MNAKQAIIYPKKLTYSGIRTDNMKAKSYCFMFSPFLKIKFQSKKNIDRLFWYVIKQHAQELNYISKNNKVKTDRKLGNNKYTITHLHAFLLLLNIHIQILLILSDSKTLKNNIQASK